MVSHKVVAEVSPRPLPSTSKGRVPGCATRFAENQPLEPRAAMDGADGEKHIDVDEFSTKVQRVLNEPGYRQSGRRIAESMRQFGGAQEAANRIERFAAGKL